MARLPTAARAGQRTGRRAAPTQRNRRRRTIAAPTKVSSAEAGSAAGTPVAARTPTARGLAADGSAGSPPDRSAWEATKRTGSHGSAESRLPTPPRPISAGRRRHDALARLLHDLQHIEPGSGQPSPTHLTVVATIDAIEGRLGALPGVLGTRGQPASLSRETLARLGCYSELNVVLLDAYGNAVGASHSRRNLTRRERRALRAQWGPTCAIDGCTSTATVPHHVEPYWMSRHTQLRDMIPACEHCHHDLHDGHRTLRLRDGRLIDEQGWVTTAAAAA